MHLRRNCSALIAVLEHGKKGNFYNIEASEEHTN
jgi:dTDP-D-glucose 4,6-dehydratase